MQHISEIINEDEFLSDIAQKCKFYIWNKNIEFTIPVKPTTKKNSGQIIIIKGRPILIPSKQYKAFEKACLPYLNQIRKNENCTRSKK